MLYGVFLTRCKAGNVGNILVAKPTHHDQKHLAPQLLSLPKSPHSIPFPSFLLLVFSSSHSWTKPNPKSPIHFTFLIFIFFDFFDFYFDLVRHFFIFNFPNYLLLIFYLSRIFTNLHFTRYCKSNWTPNKTKRNKTKPNKKRHRTNRCLKLLYLLFSIAFSFLQLLYLSQHSQDEQKHLSGHFYILRQVFIFLNSNRSHRRLTEPHSEPFR